MSRYYNIIVSPETGAPIGGGQPSQNAGAQWTNLVNGKADLGAQCVEFNIPVYSFDTPAGQPTVRIYMPSKAQISQASDFNGANIKIYGGMMAGLPLATGQAPQAGLLFSGQIYQAFANWMGTVQTLDFVLTGDGGATQTNPAALSFLWKKGRPLAEVITNTLQSAYPQNKVQVNIADNLVLTQDEAGVYKTIQQFATYVRGVSQQINSQKTYPGVRITLVDGTFTVSDGTPPTSGSVAAAIPIAIQDLIGSPTWLDPVTIQFSTVLRSDIQVGTDISFPPLAAAMVQTSASTAVPGRDANTFNGTWSIAYVMHVGNSRAPDAQSWVTVFQARTNAAGASVNTGSDTSS